MADSLMTRIRRLALAPSGIRSKLVWSFILMSAVPLIMLLLVAGWFAFPYVREFYQLERWFPMITSPTTSTWWLMGVIGLTVFISLLGSAYLAVKLVEPVIYLSHEASQLAQGDFSHELKLEHEPKDELGNLTTALNQLTSKIRDNMVELKQFGERTNQINLEIHKRVIILSGLFQIGELISSGSDLNVVLDLLVEKLALLDEKSFSFLCLQPIEGLSLTLRRAHQVDVSKLTNLVMSSSQVLVDAHHPPPRDFAETWEELDRPNLILYPVMIRNRCFGILGVGNPNRDYVWSSEWVDLVGVFVKQASIALENELLLRKTQALSVRDELTGVSPDAYIRQRLDEELKRSVIYQRPCAFVMFSIHDFVGYRQRRGEPEAERAMKKVARLIQDSVTEVDRVGRFNGNEIVAILPERNKREALELADEIRQRVSFAFAEASDPKDRLSVMVGISENPLDGVVAEDLIDRAAGMIAKPAAGVHS